MLLCTGDGQPRAVNHWLCVDLRFVWQTGYSIFLWSLVCMFCLFHSLGIRITIWVSVYLVLMKAIDSGIWGGFQWRSLGILIFTMPWAVMRWDRLCGVNYIVKLYYAEFAQMTGIWIIQPKTIAVGLFTNDLWGR